jgi:cytochrome c oxidase subunit 3
MATTVTSTKVGAKKEIDRGGGPRFPGPNGNGSRKRNGSDDPLFEQQSSAARYRIGTWVAVASIAMLFTALTSAYIVRAASAQDWRPLAMPRILWLSTALILFSSVTLESARRSLKQLFQSDYVRWLSLTALLGVGFLASQLFAWRQLARQGVYLASNPHGSFFYLLTATHGLHLLGGLLAVIYLLFRTHRPRADELAEARRLAHADAVAIYWHFMDGLWIYLFLLLFLWRSQ